MASINLESDQHQHQKMLTQEKESMTILPLIEQIDKWEHDSIQLIQQTAHQWDQIKRLRQEHDYQEMDISHLRTKLAQITEELPPSTNVFIQQDFQPFINKISVIVSPLVESKRKLMWANKTIALKSMANNKFVAAKYFGSRSLIASSDEVNESEKFRVVMINQELNHIALNAVANNLYVTAEDYGRSPLIANRPFINTWETFQVVKLNTNTIALKSLVNQRFVCADSNGENPLIANGTVPSTWETFQVFPQ